MHKIKTPSAGEIHLPIIGKKLFKLALAWSSTADLPGTKKDRSEVIGAVKGRKVVIHGSSSIKAALEATEQSAKAIRQARKDRQVMREDRALGYCPVETVSKITRSFIERRTPATPRCFGLTPSNVFPGYNLTKQRAMLRGAVLRDGSMNQRLEARIRRAVIAAYNASALDLSVAGDEDWTVIATTHPGEVGVTAGTYKDWGDRYSGSKSRYAKTAIKVEVTVPHGYLSRVISRNLAVVDGMMTIDAQPMDCREPGIEVYRARWISQGIGKSIHVHEGFIARTSDHALGFHGKTYASALTGLRRKQTLAEHPDTAAERSDQAIKAFARRWSDKDFLVSVQDAKDTGSCDYGIRSWCHANALPYDAGEVHISAVVEAYRKMPLPEARRAILHAWNRQQSMATKAA